MEGICLSSLETMGNVYFRQNSDATGYTFGVFLCDRVQGVERLSTHPAISLFPSQVPPGCKLLLDLLK